MIQKSISNPPHSWFFLQNYLLALIHLRDEIMLLIFIFYYYRGKPVDPTNLMNPTGKELDLAASGALALIMENWEK